VCKSHGVLILQGCGCQPSQPGWYAGRVLQGCMCMIGCSTEPSTAKPAHAYSTRICIQLTAAGVHAGREACGRAGWVTPHTSVRSLQVHKAPSNRLRVGVGWVGPHWCCGCGDNAVIDCGPACAGERVEKQRCHASDVRAVWVVVEDRQCDTQAAAAEVCVSRAAAGGQQVCIYVINAGVATRSVCAVEGTCSTGRLSTLST
jgi:hypothetical protein